MSHVWERHQLIFEVPGDGVLNQFVGAASGFRCLTVYLRLYIGIIETHFHAFKILKNLLWGNA